MLRIGLTGGIGTGKSIVARVFARCGAEVYYADDAAKELMTAEPRLRAALKKIFGDDVYGADGSLNRARLSALVFDDVKALRTLNGLVHPFVQEQLRTAMAACTKPVFVMEAALIYETEIEGTFDYIVVVDAEEQTRIARTMARERTDEATVRRRMAMQIPQTEKVGAADFVIHNDAGMEELEAAAEGLYRVLEVLPPKDALVEL
jgi:dephospho-CoA kinase